MAAYIVRYHAYVSGPVSGLTVTCPDGSGTVERTLTPGTLIFGVNPADPKRGDLWVAGVDGIEMPPVGFDVNPGDTITVNCTEVDLPSQSGLTVVVTTDGTFTPLQVEPSALFVQTIVSGPDPVEIVGDVVSADTTLGNVVGVLPDPSGGRTIRVGNLSGGGEFRVEPPEGVSLFGVSGEETALVLAPGERTTVVGVGSRWEVW